MDYEETSRDAVASKWGVAKGIRVYAGVGFSGRFFSVAPAVMPEVHFSVAQAFMPGVQMWAEPPTREFFRPANAGRKNSRKETRNTSASFANPGINAWATRKKANPGICLGYKKVLIC
jgi:hypothetical protein